MDDGYIKGIRVMLFILLGLGLFSCKRDMQDCESPAEECSCLPIPPNPGLGYSFQAVSPLLLNGSFSPISNNQLVLYTSGDMDNALGLYLHDSSTEESVLVYSGVIINDIEWGVNDWLTFNLTDNNVYKMRPDGSDLIQLTFNGNSNSPHWNFDATLISFRDNTINSTVIIDEFGQLVDTLEQVEFSFGATWNHPDYIIDGQLGELVLIDVGTETLHSIHSFNDDFSLHNGCSEEITIGTNCQSVANEIFYSHNLGIFKFDIDSSENELLIESCEAIRYRSPSINANQDKMLWIRQSDSLIDDNNIQVKRNLIIMDLDGSNEQIIEPF
jgi:hypothetical protein